MAAPLGAEEIKLSSSTSYFKFNIFDNSTKPFNIHVLRVDMTKEVIVKAALARNTIGRLETTGRIARRNKATAAINGMFFDKSRPHLPIGLLVIDGKIIVKSLLNRSAIGISKKNGIRFGVPKFSGFVTNNETKEKIPIFGINRPKKEDEAIIYTPEYGWTTKTNNKGLELTVEDNMIVGYAEGNSQIPRNGYVISLHGWTKNYSNTLPPGATVEAMMKLTEGWENYEQVITGGPRLVENGNIVCERAVDKENFENLAFSRKARTAIGMNKEGNLLFVVVEGKRRQVSRGATYYDLAGIMKDIGAVDAIGLDGGGSSTMYANGHVLNKLYKSYQEPVSNAIVILDR